MSIVNLSTLIIGGNKSRRQKKALSIAYQDSSKFDIVILNSEESGGIGDIKKLLTQTHQRPYQSEAQTFIIAEAQNLTLEAQNALLKALEEPPQSSRFVLTASTAQSLLSTVTSRCQILEVESETPSQLKTDSIISFFEKGPVEKYKATDKLDLDLLLLYWRKQLLSKYGLDSDGIGAAIKTKRIVNYLKLINKFKSLRKRRVSQKIIKTLVIMESPRIQ